MLIGIFAFDYILFISAHSDDSTFRRIPINAEFRNSMAMALENGNESSTESSSVGIVDVNEVTPENSSFELDNIIEPDSTSEITLDDSQLYFPNAIDDVQSTINYSLLECQNNESDSFNQCDSIVTLSHRTDIIIKNTKRLKLDDSMSFKPIQMIHNDVIGDNVDDVIGDFKLPLTPENVDPIHNRLSLLTTPTITQLLAKACIKRAKKYLLNKGLQEKAVESKFASNSTLNSTEYKCLCEKTGKFLPILKPNHKTKAELKQLIVDHTNESHEIATTQKSQQKRLESVDDAKSMSQSTKRKHSSVKETVNCVKQFKHEKLPSNKELSEHFGEQSISNLVLNTGNEKKSIISSMFHVPSTSSNFPSQRSSTNATLQKQAYKIIRKQLNNIE